jgi:hypothetical protein
MTAPDTSWDAVRRPGAAAGYFERDPLPPLDPASREFHAGTAWWLAELCRLVYRRGPGETANPRRPERGEFLASVGLREARFFDREHTRCALVEPVDDRFPRFAALVFRGTLGWPNIRADLEALPVRWLAGGKVHRGFVKVLDRVWEEVAEHLDGIEGPVLYAGHSLGAGLATLAASRWTPSALYTFGSPRTGNARFASTLREARVFRLVNGQDVITRLPPALWPYRFRHVGKRVRLERPEGGPPRQAGDPPLRYADHAPVNYVAAIEQRLLGAAAGGEGAPFLDSGP